MTLLVCKAAKIRSNSLKIEKDVVFEKGVNYNMIQGDASGTINAVNKRREKTLLP
jgi:hypothetical protein